MSAVAVFILFAICLVIAIPVSISLGIVAVLPEHLILLLPRVPVM